jgi:hypothetical protein
MSAEGTPENVNRVRTSDAEREQVAEVLRNAVTEGRLNLEEGDERLAALYQTKFRDELPSLVADLPQGQSWTTTPGPEGSRRGPGRGRGPAGQPGGFPGPFPGTWGGAPFPGGPGSGGPGGPFGGWGSAPDPSVWRRRHLFRGLRFAVIVAALVTFTLITGHFFWPIIPLFFLFQFLRFGFWRRRMAASGWGGCGHHQGGYGPDYGQDYGQGYGYSGPRSGAAA